MSFSHLRFDYVAPCQCVFMLISKIVYYEWKPDCDILEEKSSAEKNVVPSKKYKTMSERFGVVLIKTVNE